MEIEQTLDVAFRPSTVLTALSDEDFIRFSTNRGHADLVQADVNGSPEGDVTVVVRRTVPTGLIPPQARMFVGSNLEIRQVDAWARPLEGTDGPRYGTIAIEISGVVLQASGHVRLTPTEDGSRLTYDLTVRSTIPLLGATVEQKVAGGLQGALQILGDSLTDWLNDHPA